MLTQKLRQGPPKATRTACVQNLFPHNVGQGPRRIQSATTKFRCYCQRQELKKEREAPAKKKEQQKPQTPQPRDLQMSKSQIKQWKSLPSTQQHSLLQNLADHQLSNEVLDAIFSVFNGFERVRLIKFRKLALWISILKLTLPHV